MPLMNCEECGRVYLGTTLGTLCPECRKQSERLFDVVKEYIRDHDKASAQEISSATGVSQEKVLNFLREGRLIATTAATYPCSGCGTPIITGRFCAPCREKMAHSFQDAAQQMKADQGKQVGYLTSRHKDKS